jgi:hypothetical protein
MPSPGGLGAAPLTVGQWLERWLVSRAAPRSSTLRGYAAHVRLYVAPCLGQILLADLSPAHVQAMFTAITRQHEAMGRPVTTATLVRVKGDAADGAERRHPCRAHRRQAEGRQRRSWIRCQGCFPGHDHGVNHPG